MSINHGLVGYSPWTKFSQRFVSIHEVLLENSHAYFCIHCLELLSMTMERVSSFERSLWPTKSKILTI